MVCKVAEQVQRKNVFYDDLRSEWDLHSMGEHTGKGNQKKRPLDNSIYGIFVKLWHFN